jgi:hypothetical protein
MRIRARLVLAISSVALASPAFAQVTGSPAAVPTQDPDRVVCHSLPAPTGTRLGGRSECHTQRQWDQMRQEEQQTINSIQLKGMTTRPPGG